MAAQDSGSAAPVVSNATGAVETQQQTLSQQIAAMQATLNRLAAVQAANPPTPADTPAPPGEFSSADVQTPAADAAAAATDQKVSSVVNKIETVALKVVSESGAAIEDVRKMLDEVQQVRALGPGQAVQLPGVPLGEFGNTYTLSLTIKREG